MITSQRTLIEWIIMSTVVVQLSVNCFSQLFALITNIRETA